MAVQHEIEKALEHLGIHARPELVAIKPCEDGLRYSFIVQFAVPDDWTFQEPTPARQEAAASTA